MTSITTDCAVPIFYDGRQCLGPYENQWAQATVPCRFIAAARERHNLLNLRNVVPASPEDLYLAHDRDYVDGVLTGRRSNGYENTDPTVVDASLWSVGAMVQAARYAPTTAYPVCVPVSGFRQAGYAQGGAFSTFNGVAVAAARFLEDHPDAVIGVLDCGNKLALGTEDILRHHPTLATRIVFVSSAREYAGDPYDESAFSDWLESATEAINQARCQLVFYLAAVDVLSPQTGGVRHSMTGRMLRDSHVFRTVLAPMVWSFAGGAGVRPSADDTVVRSYCLTLSKAMQSHDRRQRVQSKRHTAHTRT